MCFKDSKADDIIMQHGLKKKKDIIQIVAREWRKLLPRERSQWDEAARHDKLR